MKLGLRAASWACLAGLLAWGCWLALGQAYDFPPPPDTTGYADCGEIIGHDIHTRGFLAAYRMPLATIVVKSLQYHHWLSLPALSVAHTALSIVLLFILGALLHPLGRFFWAPAAYVLIRQTSDFSFYADSGYRLLVVLSACVLVWRARAPSPARSVLLALTVGASLLWRSPLVLFPPVLAAFEWGVHHRFSLKSYWKHLAILCVVPYLLLLPWIGMNWTIQRRFIPFEHGAASLNLVTGALGLVEDTEGDIQTLVGASVDVKSGGAILGWAAREIARHPLRYARALPRRVAYALGHNPLVAALALLGLVVFRRRREFQALGLLAGYFLLIHCLMAIEHRYFWPLWPLLATLAASLLAARRAQAPPGKPTLEERVAAASLLTILAAVAAAVVYTNAQVLSFAWTFRRGPGTTPAEFSRALASHPDDVWLLQERGRQRLRDGEPAGAAEDFKAASRLEPNNPWHILQFARALTNLGRPALIRHWQGPRDERHADPNLRYDAKILRACAWIMLGKTQPATVLLQSALDEYLVRNAVVRGAQGELGSRIQAQMRTSDTGFVNRCFELQGPRPAAERQALGRILASLLPHSGRVWVAAAELAAARGERDAALRSLAEFETRPSTPADRARAAGLYLNLGRHARARSILKELSALRPEDHSLKLELAEVEFLMGEKTNALALLARVEAPALPIEGRRRLVALYGRLKEKEAESSALVALSRDLPRDPGLWIERAIMTARQGRRAEALGALARAQALPLGDDARLRIAALYRELDEPSRAAAVLEPVLRRRAREPWLLLERAEGAQREGRAQEALRLLADVESLKPSAAELSRCAVLYRRLGRLDRARALFAELAARAPRDPGLEIEQADAALLAGDAAAARAHLARAFELAPDDDARLRMSELYRRLKEPARAATLLQPLLKRARSAPLLFEQAEIEAQLGRRDAALRLLGEVEAAGARDDDALRRAAHAYQNLKDYARAVAVLDELLRRTPANAALYGDRGLCRQLQGRSEDAAADLKRAISLDPDFLPAYLTLGAVYGATGRAPLAVALYDEALARPPKNGMNAVREVLVRARKEAAAAR